MFKKADGSCIFPTLSIHICHFNTEYMTVSALSMIVLNCVTASLERRMCFLWGLRMHYGLFDGIQDFRVLIYTTPQTLSSFYEISATYECWGIKHTRNRKCTSKSFMLQLKFWGEIWISMTFSICICVSDY